MEHPQVVIMSLEYQEGIKMHNNDKRGYESLYPLLRVMCEGYHG